VAAHPAGHLAPPRDELVIKVLVALRLPGVEVQELIQVHVHHPAGLRRAGWQPRRAGWLIELGQPLTGAPLAAARDLAAAAGLTIQARTTQDELPAIRSGATAAGLLLALGILAMTIGLIRGEAVGDLRTLTATGRTRRTLTAATSGALALLGTGGAYLA
jgi:putative ABC transport system permease protein